MSVLTVLKCS